MITLAIIFKIVLGGCVNSDGINAGVWNLSAVFTGMMWLSTPRRPGYTKLSCMIVKIGSETLNGYGMECGMASFGVVRNHNIFICTILKYIFIYCF